MNNPAWANRLLNLVRSLKPSADLGAFRKAYEAAVFKDLTATALSSDESGLLLEGMKNCESWHGGSYEDPKLAWQYWLSVYHGSEGIPLDVKLVFLKCLPKNVNGCPEVVEFALQCVNAKTIEALASHRLLSRRDMGAAARGHSERFYLSALLDVALKRKVKLPRTIWDSLARGTERPIGLLTAEEALIRSYIVERSPAAAKWLVQFLPTVPEPRSILACFLKGQDATELLLQHLSSLFWKSAGRKLNKLELSAARVVADWIVTSHDALQKHPSSKRQATMVLGFVSLVGLAGEKGVFATALEQSGFMRDDFVRTTLKVALLRGESGEGLRDLLALVSPVDPIYQGVQDYIEGIASLASGEGSPERGAGVERYMATKQLVVGLVAALDESKAQSPLRDAVEATLFNAGLRRLGEEGEVMSFDPHSHELDQPGIVPGDRVVVRTPGRVLGGGGFRVVVSRARVGKAD